MGAGAGRPRTTFLPFRQRGPPMGNGSLHLVVRRKKKAADERRDQDVAVALPVDVAVADKPHARQHVESERVPPDASQVAKQETISGHSRTRQGLAQGTPSGELICGHDVGELCGRGVQVRQIPLRQGAARRDEELCTACRSGLPLSR